jgi:pimeloyl-[acyl-carrier protein] methyl ester esterase
MNSFTLVLLPGLDGTGTLFQPLLDELPSHLTPLVVRYPTDSPLGYDALLPLVLQTIPTSSPFVLLGESFSGPLAVMAAARPPAGLRGLILCASFVRNPLPLGSTLLQHFVRGACFKLAPEFIRSWALLGGFATPALRQLSARAITAVAPNVLAHRVRAVLNVDARRELSACRVPVLYLRGSHDRLIRRRISDDVMSHTSCGTMVELPAPHFVLQTQPAAAAAAISRFIATLPPD